RDKLVTGVQTCALPIFDLHGLTRDITTVVDGQSREQHYGMEHIALNTDDYPGTLTRLRANGVRVLEELPPGASGRRVCFLEAPRSEERRVGKGWSGRGG